MAEVFVRADMVEMFFGEQVKAIAIPVLVNQWVAAKLVAVPG